MTGAINDIGNNPIPKGYRIWKDRLEVAGLSHRKRDAAWLASRPKAWIEIEREPRNKFDSNAIRVYGCAKGLLGIKRKFIGYVPAEVSAEISEKDAWSEIEPRLTRTFTGDNGYLEIKFPVLIRKAV